ncbi:endoglucanase-5 [Verticillium dahliae VdLs.17]|uniref:Cellulase n=1 Tax=Verticillium dahliae (strain VdLs.17 / ATCC MYA-4575 / FGSC 10137) TaxID=498257 RepID=G2WT08_VERDV|nr:endoglucanase-5 [Verticillium dahliae VdLs.17]EGY17249.1 endoglucanase-5 [Verticillium dahliae VdLs.17]KAH6701651.1 endoglucanase-5 [Verticillium dahliae]
MHANLLTHLLPLALHLTPTAAQASGSGSTTRYWDCCKPSCAWPGKAALSSGPVTTCDINDRPLGDANARSGCEAGGTSYMCSGQSPWAVSADLAYGWAAVRVAGGDEASWCCACYELTFTSGPVAGKKMVVQATNTGADLGSNHFDLAVSFLLGGRFVLCGRVFGAEPVPEGGDPNRRTLAAFRSDVNIRHTGHRFPCPSSTPRSNPPGSRQESGVQVTALTRDNRSLAAESAYTTPVRRSTTRRPTAGATSTAASAAAPSATPSRRRSRVGATGASTGCSTRTTPK